MPNLQILYDTFFKIRKTTKYPHFEFWISKGYCWRLWFSTKYPTTSSREQLRARFTRGRGGRNAFFPPFLRSFWNLGRGQQSFPRFMSVYFSAYFFLRSCPIVSKNRPGFVFTSSCFIFIIFVNDFSSYFYFFPQKKIQGFAADYCRAYLCLFPLIVAPFLWGLERFPLDLAWAFQCQVSFVSLLVSCWICLFFPKIIIFPIHKCPHFFLSIISISMKLRQFLLEYCKADFLLHSLLCRGYRVSLVFACALIPPPVHPILICCDTAQLCPVFSLTPSTGFWCRPS